jgi:molybdopterin-guanine dinucleotide biosynthesis protein
MTTVKVIATRTDGRGFLIGRLVDVVKRHGHRVYYIKSALTGQVIACPGTSYAIRQR